MLTIFYACDIIPMKGHI